MFWSKFTKIFSPYRLGVCFGTLKYEIKNSIDKYVIKKNYRFSWRVSTFTSVNFDKLLLRNSSTLTPSAKSLRVIFRFRCLKTGVIQNDLTIGRFSRSKKLGYNKVHFAISYVFSLAQTTDVQSLWGKMQYVFM